MHLSIRGDLEMVVELHLVGGEDSFVKVWGVVVWRRLYS